MIRALELAGVGPAPRLRIDFGARLNVFAGDNGLGKSFVLETLWWALTGTWVELPAWPRSDVAMPPEIALAIHRGVADTLALEQGRHGVQPSKESTRFSSQFNAERQEWPPLALSVAPHPLPALVLFAQADGGFAVWDPARNHLALRPVGVVGMLDTDRVQDPGLLRRPPAYVFSAASLWNGVEDHGKMLCNGLIRDWVNWQERRTPAGEERDEFTLLRHALKQLSPHPEMPSSVIRPGPPVRLFVDDAREFPAVDFGYGPVPVLHTSAGMRRILSLAYLVVWAWHEHLAASRLLHRDPVKDVVLLMDEVDSHLHPTWQRRIVGSLLAVLEGLAPGLRVQAHLTTHAPLVLASLEPLFDEDRDRLFVFDLDAEHGQVTLEEMLWSKQGDAVDWLTSPAFKLGQARSLEAEQAIEDAEALMRGEDPGRFKTRMEIDQELHRVLADDDVFWPRWIGAADGQPT